MQDERLISLEQSVIRVLILLYCAGERVCEDGLTRRLDSNVKLQKLDFLLRNPDYLRRMLLVDAAEVEAAGEHARASELKQAADRVQSTGEPEVLAERMGKYLYGPFEHDYDSIYGYGVSRRFVAVRRVEHGARGQREVLLTTSGLDKVEQMLPDLVELGWYVSHARIIGQFYGASDGTTLERLLYCRFPWIPGTPNLSLIGPYEDCHASWSARS
jgi:hypothetical protein